LGGDDPPPFPTGSIFATLHLGDSPAEPAMKRLIFDLDGVLALDDPSRPYAEREPNVAVVEKLRAYRGEGFEIVIATARNMRTFSGQIGKINAVTLPQVIDWLRAHDIPFDEVHVGKPWCGTEGFYIDDRAIRPSEFLALSREEIQGLIAAEA
jgi:capsule biosynthesis phosphatase